MTWSRNELSKLEEQQGGQCGCSRVIQRESEGDESRGGQTMQGLGGYDGEFRFYSKSNGEPLKVSEQNVT